MKGIVNTEYLRKNRHGKNMLQLMTVLALQGPRNMYELAKITERSYALTYKIIKELGRLGMIYNYGKRKLSRSPGQKRKSPYKHETDLWGLSIQGLWMLILANKEVLEKWPTIKEKYNELLGKFFEYFDLIFKIGVIKPEYGYSTRHNYPNPRMIVQALIFRTVADEQSISRIYDEAIEFLKQCPHSRIVRIFWALKDELARLEKIERRCEILLEKLKPLRYPEEEIQDD